MIRARDRTVHNRETTHGNNRAITNPVQEYLTGYWRIPYAASPFTGVASEGSSGSQDLTEATNPPSVGVALNGINTCDFDGVNDRLSGNALSNFMGSTACSVYVLFIADTAVANPGAGLHYTSPYLFGDVGTFCYLSFDAAGINCRVSDGATFPERTLACGTGAWHLAQMKYGNSTLSLRLDSGSWSSVSTCAAVASLVNGVTVGRDFSTAKFFDGRIAEIGVSNTDLSDGTFDQIKRYINTKYSLSL